MQRYSEALTALNTAMNLMIEEGDTLLIAAIARPLQLAQNNLHDQRAIVIAARFSSAPPTSQHDHAG